MVDLTTTITKLSQEISSVLNEQEMFKMGYALKQAHIFEIMPEVSAELLSF